MENTNNQSMPQSGTPVMPESKNIKKWLIPVIVAVVIAALAGAYFLAARKSNNEQSAKIYHVGVLAALDFFAETTNGFKAKMTELGYVEGTNITYDVQKAPLPFGNEKIVQAFVDAKVDLILTFPTEASLDAKKVTQGTNIPVVFTNSGLDGVDLVSNLKAPGGNLTGVQFPTADNAVQRLEILHEIVPNAKRIWLAYLDGYPIVPEELRRLDAKAASLGLTLIKVPAASIDDIKTELAKRDKPNNTGMDAILIIPEPLTAAPDVFKVLADFAAKHKIPMGGAFISEESLFGYTPNAFKVGQQAAIIADKIFKGTPPGIIPVATAENDLVLNYRLAQERGFVISEALLSRAQKIVR